MVGLGGNNADGEGDKRASCRYCRQCSGNAADRAACRGRPVSRGFHGL